MKHLFACIILIQAALLTACAKDDTGCSELISGTGAQRLVTFGDSQTAGHATESSKNCGYSYANILAVKYDLRLINLAVAGSQFTSGDQYGRIMGFKFEPTDKVIFSVGFNDMSSHQSDPAHLADFRAKLKHAIETVAPQVDHLTIGTAFKPFDWRVSTQADLDVYRQTARDVVAELGILNVTVGDVGDSIAGDPAYYVSDTWHYNIPGQQVLALDFDALLE